MVDSKSSTSQHKEYVNAAPRVRGRLRCCRCGLEEGHTLTYFAKISASKSDRGARGIDITYNTLEYMCLLNHDTSFQRQSSVPLALLMLSYYPGIQVVDLLVTTNPIDGSTSREATSHPSNAVRMCTSQWCMPDLSMHASTVLA